MRVFVTGATGGVGRFVVRELLEYNFQVACLVRANSKDLLSGIVAIEGDLTKVADIETEFAKFQPDTIVHLGWIGVDKKEKENEAQIQNLQATVSLLGLARKYGVKDFIGMGSEAEYGIHGRKIDESAATLPLTKYAMTKLASGLVSEKICKDSGIRFAWLRLFSSYGPGDRPGSLMSQLIKALLSNQPMDLSACVQVWDYVHVRDIARLIVLMAPGVKESGFYNLGGGQAQVLKQIVSKIVEITGSKSVLNFGAIPYGSNHNMHLEADISKLERVYGWHPVVSLEEGLAETVEWHRNRA